MINKAVAVIGAVLLLAGCGENSPQSSDVEPASSAASVSPSPSASETHEWDDVEVVSATPDGDYTTDCDYNLDFDNGHTFTADAFITNTGGVKFTAEVKATWRQSNGKHVVKVKKVKVPVQDEDTEVYFEVPATDRQIDLIQNLDTEKQCTVKVAIIDY